MQESQSPPLLHVRCIVFPSYCTVFIPIFSLHFVYPILGNQHHKTAKNGQLTSTESTQIDHSKDLSAQLPVYVIRSPYKYLSLGDV